MVSNDVNSGANLIELPFSPKKTVPRLYSFYSKIVVAEHRLLTVIIEDQFIMPVVVGFQY